MKHSSSSVNKYGKKYSEWLSISRKLLNVTIKNVTLLDTGLARLPIVEILRACYVLSTLYTILSGQWAERSFFSKGLYYVKSKHDVEKDIILQR